MLSREMVFSRTALKDSYIWKYVFIVAVNPGHKIKAEVAYSSACNDIDHFHMHDGPGKVYPMLFYKGEIIGHHVYTECH